MSDKRWLLLAIAAGAAVVIWNGWVGLGAMAGFGLVAPLPGIVPWHLDTAITLPVSVEAYGAFALGVWLSAEKVPDRAKSFARWSAIGALMLGMTGQASYHVLAAAHVTVAPWPVTVLVSCVPVVTLGLAVALTHLLRQPGARKPPQKPSADRKRKAPQKPSDADRAALLRILLDNGEKVTIDRAMAELKAGRPVAKRALAMAMANGNGKAHG